jgi:hypothetical protein
MDFSFDFEDLVSMIAKGAEQGAVDARGAFRAKLEERTKRKLESDYANLAAAFEAQTEQIAELQRTNVILAVEVLRSRRFARVARDTARDARESALLGGADAPTDTERARTRGSAFVAKLRADSK